LAALLAAQARGELGPAQVRLVIVNRPGAGAIAHAEAANVPVRVLRHGDYATREAYDDALVTALNEAGVHIVALAGFMRLVTRRLLDAFAGRVLNIHPSLLPAFPGVDAQRQALEHGTRISGCTVHFVTEGMDEGPIVAQAAVPVLDDDDVATLTARILVEEHRLYARAVRALAEGKLRVTGPRVRGGFAA
jgi:phosphoribosylglycinamide formyltransferase-1